MLPSPLRAADCAVPDLAALVQTATDPADCPHAHAIERGVPLYASADLRARLAQDDAAQSFRRALMAEWAHVWSNGPGILVLQGVYADAALVDAVTAQFRAMITEARASGPAADHFAKPGANDRVWNALEKLCLRAPELFIAYYADDLIATACEAWLGPGYQITSQVNCVNPGGAAQTAHRDYHLGYMSPGQAERYPRHVHRLSQALTLQGAVAHVDMPLDSGPTLYLPHSQKYAGGYLVAGRADFQSYFDAHQVQLPLKKGDAVFFNPALMHAAGHNRTTDVYRMANLLQVSCAFGRAMESVDRLRMATALYPVLQRLRTQGRLTKRQQACAAAACAEAYAFPTNLDREPPIGGLAPESQQALLLRALDEGWPAQQFIKAAQSQAARKIA